MSHLVGVLAFATAFLKALAGFLQQRNREVETAKHKALAKTKRDSGRYRLLLKAIRARRLARAKFNQEQSGDKTVAANGRPK